MCLRVQRDKEKLTDLSWLHIISWLADLTKLHEFGAHELFFLLQLVTSCESIVLLTFKLLACKLVKSLILFHIHFIFLKVKTKVRDYTSPPQLKMATFILVYTPISQVFQLFFFLSLTDIISV